MSSLYALLSIVALSIGGISANKSSEEAPFIPQESLVIEVQKGETFSIPRGATRVPLLTFDIIAPCATATHIDSITFHHRGLGNLEEIEGLYLQQGTKRVSRVQSFSGNNTDITLRLERTFNVEPCSSTTLNVLADFADNALGEHRIEIQSVEDVETNVPVELINIPTIHVPLTQVAAKNQGSVSVELLRLPSAIEYGRDQILARIQLKAEDEDQELIAITFTNEGSAENLDVRRLYLRSNDGNGLTFVESRMDGDNVRLEFTPPLLLEEGDTRTLQLRGDVRASRNRTIQFVIEEKNDIEVYSK